MTIASNALGLCVPVAGQTELIKRTFDNKDILFMTVVRTEVCWYLLRPMDLSIVIPTYNRLWSLPESIASIPRGAGIETIVVDDGSTDGTWEWLSAQADVIAIRQDNWGKPAAVNAGFARATGTHVRFLDSDDQLVTAAAGGQLAFALTAEPDVCVAGYQAVYEPSGRQVLHGWDDCGDFLAQQLGERDSSHYSAYLFRREFLATIRHRPEFAFRDDRMFVLECALAQPSVAVWDAPTLRHRHHDRGRIQFAGGSTAIVTNWQELRMWTKVHTVMESSGLLTDRRARAMSRNLWELALRVGATNPREGRAIVAWLAALNPDFEIPDGKTNRLYRAAGHRAAQSIVNSARTIRNASRAAFRLGQVA